MKNKPCDHCREYCKQHDAYFCLLCLEWLENKCKDPECVYCLNRLDKATNYTENIKTPEEIYKFLSDTLDKITLYPLLDGLALWFIANKHLLDLLKDKIIDMRNKKNE